jgi:hypothetical protein
MQRFVLARLRAQPSVCRPLLGPLQSKPNQSPESDKCVAPLVALLMALAVRVPRRTSRAVRKDDRELLTEMRVVDTDPSAQ